ncbi:S-layer homology domain-containing protein [Anoxybacteroides rupiense]|uniref:S-layer homology domain-containing protein n=1 Tax=Anoxybacteroides rupiense TaxID=311460 RepID=UPI0036721AC5
MAYQPKSYRKFLAGSVSAALVATAVGPVVASAASFSDVNPNDSHAANIEKLVEKGYIKGYEDGTFKPYNNVTRGQVAKIFARILKDNGFQVPADKKAFDDVPVDAKDQELVEAAAIVKAAGVMTGNEGKLNPTQTMTRQQMAKVLVEAFDLTKPADFTSKITDLDKADEWARDYIKTLEANGVTVVTEYNPKGTVTRAAFASFVVRALDASSQTTAQDIQGVQYVDQNTLEVTFNGELKDVKKEDFAIEGVEIDSVSIKAAAAEEAKTTVVVIKTKTPLEEGKSYTISYKGQTTDKTKVDVPVVTPKVESVSAINAKQIKVTFNKELDKTTAENEAKYFIQRSGDANPVALNTLDVTADAKVSEDGKSVIITTTNAIEASLGITGSGTPFKFTVDGVKAKDGKTFDKTTFVVSVEDKTAPTFVKATASAKTTTNTITLEFSEPVQATSGVVKVNGTIASVTAGSTPNTLTVTTGTNLEAGKSYTVEVLNFKDYAGNFLTPNPVSTTVTVTADVVAPVVSDVKVVRDNLIEVTFDKSMNPSTLNNTNIKLLDGNYTNIAATNIVSVLPKANTNNKVFEITLDNTPALPFNDNGVFNATLVFTDAITDSAGNKMVTTNKVVTLTKDTTKPAVASVTFKKADSTGATYGGVALTNGAIVIKFNEKVNKLATAVGTLKLIDNNGNDVTSIYITNAEITAAQVNPDDQTEIVIPLATQVTTASNITAFTLRLPSDFAKDLSISENPSEAAVVTFNVEAGVNNSADTTKPVYNSGIGVSVSAGNVINIPITEANALDTATVLDLNNYRLDGAPLPAGTYVTISGTAPNFVVHLNLPSGSISKSRNYALNVSGIKDKAGNTIDAFAVNTVALVDDVKPELKTATLNTNGTLSIGFSETVNSVVATTQGTSLGSAKDFILVINGKEVKANTTTNRVAFDVVDGVGADAGKYVLTVNTLVEEAAAPGGTDYLYIDADGDNAFNATTDIVVASAVDSTGSTTNFTAGTYNLNNASTLVIKTVTAPSIVTDTASPANTLKGSTTITVK